MGDAVEEVGAGVGPRQRPYDAGPASPEIDRGTRARHFCLLKLTKASAP